MTGIIAVFIVVATAGIALSLLAFAHLAPRKDAFWRYLTRGPFAEREIFTDKGWRYRNFALGCGGIGALLLALEAFLNR
jgi:hypothetical protein